jgi:hypothetical protein
MFVGDDVVCQKKVRSMGLKLVTYGLWPSKTHHCATQVNSLRMHLVIFLSLFVAPRMV